MKLKSYLQATAILVFFSADLLQPLAAQDSNQAKLTPTGSLSTGRAEHTATLLPNGRVLIAGGDGSSDCLASAELYCPDKGVFVQTADMNSGRTNHTATLLANGQVLVVGGQFLGRPLASAELYNPVTGLWRATGSLHIARAFHTATLLSDGQVLVVGGSRAGTPPAYPQGAPPRSALDITELYDPTSGKWTVVDNLHIGRYWHTATLLRDGRVLVAGGFGANGASDILESVELYSPKAKNWTITTPLPIQLTGQSAVLLRNGQVLMIGGKPSLDSNSDNAEVYDSSQKTWTLTGNLPLDVNALAASLLPNGQVLATGGSNENGPVDTTELCNYLTGTWEFCASMQTGRSLHTSTLLKNGQVLIVGGVNALGLPLQVQATAELYNPATQSKSDIPKSHSDDVKALPPGGVD